MFEIDLASQAHSALLQASQQTNQPENGMTIKYSDRTTAMDEARNLRASLAAHQIKVTTRVVRGYIVIDAAKHGVSHAQVEQVIGTCHGTIID